MDPAELFDFLEWVRAMGTFRTIKISPLKRLKVSNRIIEFSEDKPVHLYFRDTTHILEEAERVNQAALDETFGRSSSREASGPASSLVPPASLVSLSPVLSPPQPATTSKPTSEVLPQHTTAAEALPQHSTEEALPQHSTDAATTKTIVLATTKPVATTKTKPVATTKTKPVATTTTKPVATTKPGPPMIQRSQSLPPNWERLGAVP